MKIRFTKAYTVNDGSGKSYQVGDVLQCTQQTATHFVSRGVGEILEQNDVDEGITVRIGNVGTRLFSHRTGNFNNAVQNTFRCIVEIAADNFSAVRPVFINGADGLTYTVAGCNARALSGVTDVSGHVQMLAGSTTDGIHQNDRGSQILAALLVEELKRLIN